MAESVPLFEKSAPVVRYNSSVDKNLEYARSWFKKNKPTPKIKFRVEDAGGGPGGVIKKGILLLSFDPDWNDIWPSMQTVISTLQDELTFRNDLNEQYKLLEAHVEKMEEKRKNGKLKLKSDLKKKEV